MERFPVEIIYVLVFLGIVLFNILTQRAARRRQQEEQAQVPEQPEPLPADEAPLEDIWGRPPPPASVPAPVLVTRPAPLATGFVPPAPRRHHPVRARLADKRDLRRAIVLMTVLGPCRAQEAPERTRL